MKRNLLSFIFVIFSLSIGYSQTFTIEQSVTGQNDLTDVRGQSFTPSVQGTGDGSVGTNDTVYLHKFSMIYSFSSSSEADTLYIYSQLPDSTNQVDNGKGGVLIGKSIAKTSDDFPYTDYVFNWIPLNKDLTYYAIFREDINPEASAGSSYAGGSAIRNREDTLGFNDFLDLKFIASFSPAPNNETDIVSFSVGSQVGSSIINNNDHTVGSVIEYGSALGYVSTTIEVSPGATVAPSSSYIDYSEGPVTFTVTAENGITKQEWTVTVTNAPSYYADIESFSFNEQTGEASITYGDRKIDIEVDAGTNLSSLVPTIAISEGASITPNSGVSTDFSSGSVVYTVTAEDGVTTKEWTVNVTVEEVTGIDLNNDHSGFYAYPTSFENELRIINDNPEEVTIEIYNSAGQLKIRTEIKGYISTINTSMLEKGLYFIKPGNLGKTIKVAKQ